MLCCFMLRGLIAGAAAGLASVVASQGDASSALATLLFFVLLGALLDLFLGRRGAFVVSAVGFVVMLALIAAAFVLADLGAGVSMEVEGGPLYLAVFVVGVLWAIFYAVYRIVERYVG